MKGEVLTSDESKALMEEHKASKQAEKHKKGKKTKQKEGLINLNVRIAKILKKVLVGCDCVYITHVMVPVCYLALRVLNKNVDYFSLLYKCLD